MFTPSEWCSGGLIRELFTGEQPYKGLSVPQIVGNVGFNEGFRLELPKRVNVDPDLRDIMMKCLRRNPKDRPVFGKIVSMLSEFRTKLKSKGELKRQHLK